MFPQQRLRVVFMGSDTLSCPFLSALSDCSFAEVVAGLEKAAAERK